jgi:hypothetical protein
LSSDLDLAPFLAEYQIDADLGAPRTELSTTDTRMARHMSSIEELLDRFGGMSFGNGLYRLHRLEDVAEWNETIATAWSETAHRVSVFAYDWLGRQFALFEQEMVLQFSAGVLDWVEIPGDPATFHNQQLTVHRQDALADAFYQTWLQSGGARPNYSMCIGYKKPLFLGGVDWIENLEAIDMDVYWTVTAPIIAKAIQVGVGGVIGRIEIDE